MNIPIKPRAGTAATKLQDAFQLAAPLALELDESPVGLESSLELLEDLEEVSGVALSVLVLGVLVLTTGGVVLGVVTGVVEVATVGGSFGVVMVLGLT